MSFQPDSFTGELVQVWSQDLRTVVSDVVPAMIVRENKHNIGLLPAHHVRPDQSHTNERGQACPENTFQRSQALLIGMLK